MFFHHPGEATMLDLDQAMRASFRGNPTNIAPFASMDRGSVGRQFSEQEIVSLTVVAVAAINGRNCLGSGFQGKLGYEGGSVG
jgi:hypothetical protein